MTQRAVSDTPKESQRDGKARLRRSLSAGFAIAGREAVLIAVRFLRSLPSLRMIRLVLKIDSLEKSLVHCTKGFSFYA